MSKRIRLLSEDEARALNDQILLLSAWLVHRIERGKGFAATELEAAAVHEIDSPGDTPKDAT